MNPITAVLTANIPWQTILMTQLQQGEPGNILVTLLLIVLAIILLVVFWQWWQRIEGEDLSRDKRILNIHEANAAAPITETRQMATAVHVEPEQHTAVVTSPEPTAVPEPATPVEPDDLTKIEGIGPKISELLHNAGILTFAQLAAADTAQVDQILADAGPRFQLADSITWAQQANLAAAGAWEELATLQDNLKGGRQVSQ